MVDDLVVVVGVERVVVEMVVAVGVGGVGVVAVVSKTQWLPPVRQLVE
jgi:hypothetical protein